ncbi:ABC transporter permease [Terasakiella brassicae]|uniref:ABC transporter permease n=1 Tax=Terasakiella brassicae TaxID=1634917 RepID=A0A917BZ87_9PROT|nr:ABC transporter permease [Terasakiella brassicae]GGF62222.1 ABC transporter permease [Terasakiella brassicae]
MSLIAFLGAIETGLLFGIVALGVFISFRVLDFPDLTVDGSLPMGAATSATLIVAGVNPFLSLLGAIIAGALAGLVTAWLNVRLGILHLLASILTMIALYSVNLRIMGKPNQALLGEETVFTPFEKLIDLPYYWVTPIVLFAVIVVLLILLNLFLSSETGLGMRATGVNGRMAAAQGINTGKMKLVGIALSNAMVALAGALFAQIQGGADITMGVGVIVVGLAAVILGEATFSTRTIILATIGCVIGSILYRVVVAVALNADFIGLQAQDLKLVTAVLVVLAMTLPGARQKWAKRKSVKGAGQ